MLCGSGSLRGTAEAAYILVRRWIDYLGDAIPWRYSLDVVWMAPLALTCIFALVAALLLMGGLVWRGVLTVRILTFALCVLAGYILPRSLGLGIHPLAALTLATALALQAARFAANNPLRFRSIVLRSTPSVLGLIVVAGLAIHAVPWLVERRPSLRASRPGMPNVLLIILDTARAASLSVYGYARPTTPKLESWAKDAVVFDRAIATSPWTLPTHAAVFTGRYHHEISADWGTPLDETHPTLAEVLASSGFETAGFVANYGFTRKATGLHRGFEYYRDELSWPTWIMKNSWAARELAEQVRELLGNRRALDRKPATQVNEEFLNWLPDREERPFFVFLNYFDAHDPYESQQPFNTMFTSLPPKYWISWRLKYTEEEMEEFRTAYDVAIAYLDHQLGTLFEELDERGLLDSTLVIVTGDHGEQFGEPVIDLVYHGNSLYMPLIHVPLIASFPRGGVPGGKQVQETVSLRNIPATVLDLLGLDNSVGFPGTSLRRCWDRSPSAEPLAGDTALSAVTDGPAMPWHPVYNGPMKSLVVGSRALYTERGRNG